MVFHERLFLLNLSVCLPSEKTTYKRSCSKINKIRGQKINCFWQQRSHFPFCPANQQSHLSMTSSRGSTFFCLKDSCCDFYEKFDHSCCKSVFPRVLGPFHGKKRCYNENNLNVHLFLSASIVQNFDLSMKLDEKYVPYLVPLKLWWSFRQFLISLVKYKLGLPKLCPDVSLN